MKFEELYTPINRMQPSEAVAFFLSFCKKREESFVIPVKKVKVKATKEKKEKKGKMISVSPAELALLKKMGMV